MTETSSRRSSRPRTRRRSTISPAASRPSRRPRRSSPNRWALPQQVRGVRAVAQRSYSGGTQELDVTLVGSTEQFAQELESKKLGRFTVRVTGVTANTVDVELGP